MAVSANVRSMINHGHIHSVILAGGFGSRLAAITNDRNKWAIGKPACPIGNLRNIEFAVRALTDVGVNNINYLTCVKKESVRDVIEQTKRVYKGDVTFDETPESEPLDTAGAVGQLVHNKGWHNDPEGVVIVHSADVVYNAEIGDMLETHLFNRERNGTVATLALNAVPWNENISRLGTAMLPNMPFRAQFETDDLFFESMTAWYQDLIKGNARSHQILGFGEKLQLRRDISKPLESRFEGLALSNLNNSSVYIMNTSLFKFLLPYLTKKDKAEPLIDEMAGMRDDRMMEKIRQALWSKLDISKNEKESLSDWSKHVFKLFMSSDEMQQRFPINGYLLPQSANWRDAGTAMELLKANMDVLRGALDTGLTQGGFFDQLPNRVFKSPTSFVDNSAKLENVIVEDGAHISGHVFMKDCVVGRNVKIDKHVVARETVFMQKHRHNVKGSVVVENTKENSRDDNMTFDRCMVLGCDVESEATNKFDSLKIYETQSGDQAAEGLDVIK